MFVVRGLVVLRRTLIAATIVALVLSAGTLDGCAPRKPVPSVVHSYQISGAVWPMAPEAMVSPDRKWVLTMRSLPSGLSLVCLPTTSEANQPLVVAEADAAWLKDRLFGYFPLGWTDAGAALFATSGWQNVGSHKGEYGVGVWEVTPGSGPSRELGFLPLSQGLVQAAYYVKERGKVYFHVPQYIWEFDLEQRTMRQVKGGLPVYDGLFYPRLSPTGEYFAYDIYEEDRAGVCLLDVATGQEKVLLDVGDSLSFYPSWSPDGKYIACYTVPRKPESNTGTWEDYEILPAEDGPQPVAPAITVVDTQGNLVQTITVKGKLLGGFKWAQDSKALGFAVRVRKEGDLPTISVESVFLATLGDRRDLVELGKVAQTSQGEPGYVLIHSCRGSSMDMLFEAWSEKGPELIYIQQGKQPVRMAGSLTAPGIVPICGDSMVSLVQQDDKVGVWQFGGEGAHKVVDLSGGEAWVVGLDRGMMVVASGNVVPLDKEAVRSVLVVHLAP
ncbi:MAG: hypothetical protein ACPLPR_07030 [Bacillota bacterium]